MVYKLSIETDYGEAEYFFDDFTAAKSQYISDLTCYMLKGWRFSIALFSGIVDKHHTFWHHHCIVTFDYDGDSSVWEGDND